MSALWPVHTALVARLKTDGALMAAVTGVHDGRAAQDAAKPYVVIGEPTEVPGRVLGTGWSQTLTCHIWTSGPGRKEALQILGHLAAAVSTDLALDGFNDARLRPEFVTVLEDPDGSRHAVVRYRILALEAA